MLHVLKVSTDFSDIPGPRYIREGLYSGEDFRDRLLFPRLHECIERGDTLQIDLDGTQGYGTSFLEEAFGGLIRVNHLSLSLILEHIIIVSEEEPYLKDDIEEYMKDAENEK